MKKAFFCMTVAVMLFTFCVPAAAADSTQIKGDPNFEIYEVTQTETLDVVSYEGAYVYFDFDAGDVYTLEHYITISHPLVYGYGDLLYNGYGTDYFELNAGEATYIYDTTAWAAGFYVFHDEMVENVTVTCTTVKFRLAGDPYQKGYDQREIEDVLALITVLEEDYSSNFNGYDGPEDDFEEVLRFCFDKVVTNVSDQGYDLGYERGYQQGKTEAYDGTEIVDSVDKLAGEASVTLLQILNTKILDYSLMEFLVALVLVIVVIVGTKIIGLLI